MRFMRLLAVVGGFVGCAFAQAGAGIDLPSSQVLLPGTPGGAQLSNSFPTAVALSPDGRFAALLNNGRGTYASQFSQSIALEDLRTGQLSDFPDPRLKVNAHQTYFLGLAFSGDGRHLYASMASLTDPTGRRPNDTGNGIAVYRLEDGRLTAERFIAIAPQPLGVGRRRDAVHHAAPAGMLVPYPAGLAVVAHAGGERLLVADNLSDDALLLDAASGRQLQRFDLGGGSATPASYPYTVVASPDGRRAWCSLWNASAVAELDLETGRVLRRIPLLPPAAATGASSHPTALLVNADASRLYVALANRDRVAEVDTRRGAVTRMLSTELPGEKQGGTYPNALALSGDGRDLFVADAGANAVAVLRLDSGQTRGFVPTEWYPTALARAGDRLLIATGKSEGTGPNGGPNAPRQGVDQRLGYPYIASLIRGSLASVDLAQLSPHLAAWTQQVLAANHMASQGGAFTFAGGRNPIRHVIYIIKENRTYDEVLGDDPRGNGDASLAIFGRKITPNVHRLAADFVLLDNYYCDSEVSADGHNWATAAYSTDYVTKLWPSSYSDRDRNYDFEQQGPASPSGGYLWDAADARKLTVRDYGEFVKFHTVPWQAAASGLAGRVDPTFAGFDMKIMDQTRVDSWMREFRDYVRRGDLPALEIMRLPDDHTAATRPGARTPYAMVADNDFALARMVEAVSRSRYWKDTIIFVTEDDAQAGPDHVSDQRAEALVVGGWIKRGYVDHTHYTMAGMIHTIEMLLNLRPMSQFDAGATPMFADFATAPDLRSWTASKPLVNLNSVNPAAGPDAQASMRLDLTRADAADPQTLNAILFDFARAHSRSL